MNIKEYQELQDAYQGVYDEIDESTAMSRRGYDETKLRQRAGGGEAADRATSLENRPTYGDANKAKQRQRYARAQRGDFRQTASSNPGLHGYAHKSNDPSVQAKQAARGAQRGALTPNERKKLNMGDDSFDTFDAILEHLVAEGYADTNENAIAIMANMSEEWREEILDEKSDDTYLEPNFQKREENNKKAIEDMKKTKAHKDMVATVKKKFDEEVETDVFTQVLEYLVAEGYADTNENAIAIMANMSEEWREEILDENRMDKELNTPNWDKVYDRNERDFPNHTRKPERKPSGKLETPNQTTKRVGKERVQSHKDTRGVKQIPGAKGVRMQFGRAF